MVTVERFKKEHLDLINEHESQLYLNPYMNPQAAEALEADELSRTIFVDARPVFCGGVWRHWHNRGEAWGIFDSQCKSEFLSVHHQVRKFLGECPVNRIEAIVETTFVAGHRWMQSLGFSLEVPLLRRYLPPGKDASLYVLLKETG